MAFKKNSLMNIVRGHTFKFNFNLKKRKATHIQVINFNYQGHFIVFSSRFYSDFPLLAVPYASQFQDLPNPLRLLTDNAKGVQ